MRIEQVCEGISVPLLGHANEFCVGFANIDGAGFIFHWALLLGQSRTFGALHPRIAQ
jgi:hypothetical protein